MQEAQQVKKIKRKDTEEKAAYARCLGNYSTSLYLAGNNEAGFHQAERVNKLFHELNKTNRNRFESNFAKSLNDLANRLNAIGKNKEALQHAQQAVDIYRRLAKKNPDKLEPAFAMSLNNLANRLNAARKNDEALQHAQQAVDIYRRLAKKNPNRFGPDFAGSLNNIANHLSAAGKNEDALQNAQQAVNIYQLLAKKNPDRFEPAFAMSLNNLANSLSAVGKNEEVLQLAQQSLDIRQRLATNNPDRFGKEYHDTTCHALLLGWLEGTSVIQNTPPQFPPLPEYISEHQRLLSQLYAAFVEGCLTSEQEKRSQLFDQVLAIHRHLITAARIDARPYWLCASAWCGTFSPQAMAETDWQSDWTSYAKNRQENIPWWMEEVARRLHFQWPPASSSGRDITTNTAPDSRSGRHAL